jgi:arylsulfatase A-like enzyme
MRRAILLLFTALWLLAGSAAAGTAASRPNFILIYTDDQRWDTLGVMQKEQGERGRFPWLRTPNLDRLASEGIRFRNAFVVNSLCAPSRATFLTGRYGHLNGVVNNHTPFPETNVTFASELRKAGYRTGYVGKWHHGSQSGQRPGFDYSASFVGQGKYFDCPIEVNGVAVPSKGWVDDVSTDYALGFLKENRERPFAMVLGFKSAHGPFDPPERHRETYAGEEARPVPNLGSTAVYNRTAAPAAPRPPAARPPAARRPTNLGYFRCLTAMDDNVGRVLAALDELKLAQNTMVVFASDNGYYLGEHSLGDKRSAYDESLRIPFLVRYPPLGKKGSTVDQMVLNVDPASTFLDYAGLKPPREMQGRSLRPLLEGKSGDWRKAYFYCYFFERGFRIPTVTAVRTEQAKLIRYPGHDEWTELFDLEKDPYEMRNLIAEPSAAGLRKTLEAEYDRQKDAVGFRIPDFADDPAAAPPPPAPPGAGLNAWVLDYRWAQDMEVRVKDASGKGNDGIPNGVVVADGRNGGTARRFDGKSHVAVERSASLDPANKAWTISVTFKAGQPNGVLLACGGRSQGYSLYLEQGKPVFAVTAGNRTSRVTASRAAGEGWVTLVARITSRQQLTLSLDGKPAGQAPLHALIARQPNEGVQIGADTGSQVEERELPPFSGLIEAVRIYSGGAP